MIPKVDTIPDKIDMNVPDAKMLSTVLDSIAEWERLEKLLEEWYVKFRGDRDNQHMRRYMDYLIHDGNREEGNLNYHLQSIQRNAPEKDYKWQVAVAVNRLINFITHATILLNLLNIQGEGS